jgi:hypothetical protein
LLFEPLVGQRRRLDLKQHVGALGETVIEKGVDREAQAVSLSRMGT